MARDNRAALRINKVQLSNDTLKRQQQQQAPDHFDPGMSMDTEQLFKDPLKQKESEHEQEWKFRQVIDSPGNSSSSSSSFSLFLFINNVVLSWVSHPLIKALAL